MKVRLKISLLSFMFIAFLTVVNEASSEDQKISRYSSAANKATDWTSGGTKQQLNFKYASAKASLRQNGSVAIEGYVQHLGLLCGTYSGGIRFGKGNPGCVDVEWITEPVYLTSKKHCNNATLSHSGADIDSSTIEHFDEITCGQFLLKCEGMCK